MSRINILYKQSHNKVVIPFVENEENKLKSIYNIIKNNPKIVKNNINREVSKILNNKLIKKGVNNSININNINEVNNSNSNIQIYNKSFNRFKLLANTNIEFQIYLWFYTESSLINLFIINETKIKNFIQNSYLSKVNYNAQITFYNSLNKISKYVFNYHKKNPDIFSGICRNINVNRIKSKLVFSEEKSYRLNRINSVSNIPTLRMMNRLYNLFHYVPPLTKDIYVYRIEKDFPESIIHKTSPEYTFRGFISTTNDPLVAITFNKGLIGNSTDKSIFLLYIIKIPIGSQVIIPSIGYIENDTEVEILLKDNSKIKNIKRKKNINKKFENVYPSNIHIRTSSQRINVTIQNIIIAELC